jgi:ribosome modulation factor
MSNEYKQGQEHHNLGKSEAYNPYRNKGTTTQFLDWIAGWRSAT